jgi:hypothetical protein
LPFWKYHTRTGRFGVGSLGVIVGISRNQIGKVGREGGDVAVLGRGKGEGDFAGEVGGVL